MPKTPAKPKGLTKEQLQDMIRDSVAGVIQEQVDAALEPVMAQQTEYMERLRASSTIAVQTDPNKKGIGAARFIRALAFGRGDLERSKYFCDKVWDDALGDEVKKSLMAGDFTGAGFLIPPTMVPEIIELLRSQAVVRAAGARVIPMNNGSLTIRKHNVSATATYVGEATNIGSTAPEGGQIVLTSKKLAAIVPISNDLLAFTDSPSADEFVRDDLVMSLAVREDQAFIRDDGLQDKPKGMRFWAQAANVTATNGTSSTQIEDDFKDLVNALETNDVRMIRPAWFMNPRSKNHLRNLRDANGNLIYPETRGVSPTLYGWPLMVTTSIPINLGAGTETEIYLADMVDLIIGEATGLEIAVDSSASYLDGGQLVSAFTRDETLMRAIMRHDFAVRHAESLAVKTAVVWGA